MIDKSLIRGEITGFPAEIVEMMLQKQVAQGNPKNVEVFWHNRSAGGGGGGFTWHKTEEGESFWSKVIDSRNFGKFFEKYPIRHFTSFEETNGDIIYSDGMGGRCTLSEIAEPSYKGEIKDFPKEVVNKMLDYQERQGNPRNVQVFERCGVYSKSGGGFDWDDTLEGGEFWSDVISLKRFSTFFEKYPKTSKHVFSKPKNKTQEHGIKVQRPVATVNRGKRTSGHRIQGRRSSTTIGFRQISNKAVSGF